MKTFLWFHRHTYNYKVYRCDGWIVKILSFFTAVDAVFYEQIHDYNIVFFNKTFAV